MRLERCELLNNNDRLLDLVFANINCEITFAMDILLDENIHHLPLLTPFNFKDKNN